MKNLNPLLALFLCIAILTASCSKDDGDSNSDKVNYFFCKIDGEDWEADGISQPTLARLNAATTPVKQLDFFGSDPAGPSISIIVLDYDNAAMGECMTETTYYGTEHTKAGDNFTISTGESNYARFVVTGAGGISKDGFVRITGCENGSISGTFEFVVTDLAGAVVHTITDGRFDNVNYVFSE